MAKLGLKLGKLNAFRQVFTFKILMLPEGFPKNAFILSPPLSAFGRIYTQDSTSSPRLPPAPISLFCSLSLFNLILSLAALYTHFYNLNVSGDGSLHLREGNIKQCYSFLREIFGNRDKFLFSKLLKSANNVFAVNSFMFYTKRTEIQAEVLKDFLK